MLGLQLALKMSVPELKDFLRSKGLRVTGDKKELARPHKNSLTRYYSTRESNNMEVKHCFPENPLPLTAQRKSGARETPSCSGMKFVRSESTVIISPQELWLVIHMNIEGTRAL